MMELTAFLHKLKFYRPKLTKQQVRTLEGAVLNGKNNNGNAVSNYRKISTLC